MELSQHSLFFPQSFKYSHPHPETPWMIRNELRSREEVQIGMSRIKLTEQDPEWKFIFRYFSAYKPPNRSIKEVHVL